MAGASREVIIHIRGDSRHVYSWLKPLKVRFKDTTYTNVILTQKLIAPHPQGGLCAVPFPTQIEWLLRKFLAPTNAGSGVHRLA